MSGGRAADEMLANLVMEYPQGLTGEQVGPLCDALCEAFPQSGRLSQMVRARLHESLASITASDDLRTRTLQLIEWAAATGRIEALVYGALAEAPGSASLRAFARSRGYPTDEVGTAGVAADPRVGRLIANGRYRVVGRIREGVETTVFEGEQRVGDQTRPVSIKMLQPDLAKDPSVVARFHQEAGIVSLLEHPNTIRFYEAGQLDDGQLFIVMEFVRGESLANVVAQGALAPPRVAGILAQVGGALDEAHEHGIVHRGITPEGIVLVQKAVAADFVKVLDFSIARRDESIDADPPRLARQGRVLGTPPYMSPEQFTGQRLGPTSDIYALAVVAYEMLTGRFPFVGTTTWEYAVAHLTQIPLAFEARPAGLDLPTRQKRAVMRALSKSPEERPQTIQEFLYEFGD